MLIGASELRTMTPAQHGVYDAIASGPRKDVPLPFLAMLDVPHLADSIQSVGSAIRFSGSLSDEYREVAILSAAAAFGSGYEWNYHEKIALELGMGPEWIQACRSGDTSAIEDASVKGIIELCWGAVRDRKVPLDALASLTRLIGRSGASEVVAISGYYPLLALFLSAGELDTEIRPVQAAEPG